MHAVVKKFSSTNACMHEPTAFTEIVATLEVDNGRRLNGSGRELCLRAFTQNQVGFAACVNEALRRGRHNSLGLLVRMVRDGDWNVPQPEPPSSPSSPPPPPEPVRGRGVCFVCEREHDDSLFVAGQWWCVDHEGEAPAGVPVPRLREMP
jgi:hypothetical protein